MFARPRPKKSALPPLPRKRKNQHGVEEIKFDDTAREDYLTGFHKRKLQRTKNAQDQAAKRARQEKIDFRKQLREDRKRKVEEHVQHVEAMLKEARHAGYVGSDDDEEEEKEVVEGDGVEEWGGIQDDSTKPPGRAVAVATLAGVIDRGGVDHEEEYIDEERHTTVTVESVNVSKDGLTSYKAGAGGDEESGDDSDETAGDPEKKQQQQQAASGTTKNRPPKKKKPKFRYETKSERQLNQRKQKVKNKRKSRD
ncbi:nucleolar protein 12-domain-containing protein [Xylariomycetidae sp. FL2044]|nr:nucleolar protein 12-domain-containing protein [Xylariomycetidae sp. FL2044]